MSRTLTPSKTRGKYVRLLVLLLLLFYILSQIFSFINQFFDIYSVLPLKTLRGIDFSLGYPQNWKNADVRSGLPWLEPQFDGFIGLLNESIEPQDYNGALFYLSKDNADAYTSPGAGADQERAWEQRFPHYKHINLPETEVIGGTTWVQQAATYELDFKDGSSVQLEQITLSTIHVTKDHSRVLFTINFSASQDVFDHVNNQAFQRILHSFTFL